MTAKQAWQNTKIRASTNWARVERFLASTVDGALTTWETGWRALQAYIAVPKNFLWVTLGGVLVFDVMTKGSTGSIDFIVKTFNSLFQSASNGNSGWVVVAIAALFFMFNKQK